MSFARSQGGRRGSDPHPSPVLWPGNIPLEPLHCSLTRKECSENKVIALHSFILGYTVMCQLLAYLRVPDLRCMVMANEMRNLIIGCNRKNLIMHITYLANCKFRQHISIRQFSTYSRQYSILSTIKNTAFQSSRQNTDTTTYR